MQTRTARRHPSGDGTSTPRPPSRARWRATHAAPTHRPHLYRRARRVTALLLGCEVACFAVAAVVGHRATGTWHAAGAGPAGAPLPRLAANQQAMATGSVAALLAAALLFPIAVMLCHLIGSRRGPLLPIAAGFSLVALCLQAVAAGIWLFVLPRLAHDGGAGARQLADAVAVAADGLGGRLAGFFTAIWVWALGGMVIRTDRLPSWPGRLGVLVALALLAAVAAGGTVPRLAAAAALQGWFVALLVVTLGQAAAATDGEA